MKTNTSMTITKEEKAILELIQIKLCLSASASIRIAILGLLNDLSKLDKFLEERTKAKELIEFKEVIHISLNKDILRRLDALADTKNTSRSKIVGAAIRASEDLDLNSL